MRWVTCTYEEYKKWQPRARPQSGILEVFGQQVEVTTAIGDDDCPPLITQKRLYPPKIVARGNASCIHSAVGDPISSSFHFPVQKLKEMGTDSTVFLDEIPDACKANKRHKTFLVDALKDTDGAFINEHGTCAAHALHNMVTKTIGESDFVGHLHAVQTVGSINQRRTQLLGAARHVLSSTLKCTAGVPPPEFDDQSTFILNTFLYRKSEHVRSEAAIEGIFASHSGTCARASEQGFRRYVNGNKALDAPWHWCNGCCTDPETGLTTRERQVENFLAALVAVGFFSGSLWAAAPSKARWLSSSSFLCVVVCGLLVHGLLRKAWEVAFPIWNIEQPLGHAEETDFHKMVRSKCFRAKLYLCQENTPWKAVCISVASLPVDHLMQRLQALDEAGDALMDLRGFNNTINLCLGCLFDYGTTLRADPMKKLSPYFSGRGVEYLACVHLYIFRLCFSLAAQIWFHLASTYASSPYDLLELVSPNGTESSRTKVASGVFSKKTCCLDRGISLKVRKRYLTPGALLGCRSIRLVLRMWAKRERLCNMSLERLLATFRRNTPKHGSVDRLVISGWLAQIQGVHLKAGGEDIRKFTRRQALALGVPLRSRGRSSKHKQPLRHRPRVNNKSEGLQKKHFINRQVSKLKQQRGGQRQSRQAYKDVVSKLVARWDAGDRGDVLSDSEEIIDDVEDEDENLARYRAEIGSYESRIGRDLWSTSTASTPVSEEAITEVIRLKHPGLTRTCGFTERLRSMRKEMMDDSFVADSGAIPSNQRLSYEVLCHHKHPFVCQADIHPDATAFHRAFNALVRDWPIGTLLAVRADYFESDEDHGPAAVYDDMCWSYRVKGFNTKDGFSMARLKTWGPFDKPFVDWDMAAGDCGFSFEMSQKLALEVVPPSGSQTRFLSRCVAYRYEKIDDPSTPAEAAKQLPIALGVGDHIAVM